MVRPASGVELRQGDLGIEWLSWAREAGEVGCDIETSGLDWRTDTIATVQVAAADKIIVVRVAGEDDPKTLIELMTDASVTKVFHHAPFDLRFISKTWNLKPRSIACTKVAAKIVDPGQDSAAYSLKPTLQRYLGVDIDKGAQVSDWAADNLSQSQLDYAANDVRYLVRLLNSLRIAAAVRGVTDLVEASFTYLPTRAALDLGGAGDVFSY